MGGKLMKKLTSLHAALLLLGVSATAAMAEATMTAAPDAPSFDAQGKVSFVGINDILEYKALPAYGEPDFVKALVDAGKLPPVAERLPKEPMVYKTGNMKDGIGVYGDVMRHVIGGRPEGWNYWAGQSQGWGGIDIGLQECLTRTGPLFQVKAEELAPLPNVAKSWEWSADGKQLTMKLIEGAKWSDGDAFDADDIMYHWEFNILDPEVNPLGGETQETFGVGTTLEKVDAYTIKWTFQDAFPTQVLYSMAYMNFCPGPSHILAPQHPKNSKNTYEQYKNAFGPNYMAMPTLGAWVVVEHRPDDIVVLRRNPYYWKVDEAGNQLPYLNEMHYRLSTWGDRDVQAVAGTGDFSNLEQAENYVEALKKAADPASPARLEFGQRTIGYVLHFNLSTSNWGEPDDRSKAVRKLNRDLHFRKGVTSLLDRQRLGESLVKGPFTAIYPGGIYSGTSYYDQASTVYYPFDLEAAKAELALAGLKDTDGNGILNFPDGGKDVEITLLGNTDYASDKTLVEGVVAMAEQAGLRVIPNMMSGNDRENARKAGKFDWHVWRAGTELVTVVQETKRLAPVGPSTNQFHQSADGTAPVDDLLDFEKQLADIVNKFIASKDPAERIALMKDYQKIATENVYWAGLTQYPGALIMNKRFANIAPGAPIFMYNWAEDNIIRERVFVPKDMQQNYELYPNLLADVPGGKGVMK
jgi:peptide/nickel transport system substrate-binding protein